MNKFIFLLKMFFLGFTFNLQAMLNLTKNCAPVILQASSDLVIHVSRACDDQQKKQLVQIGKSVYAFQSCLFCKDLTGYRCELCLKAAYCSLKCQEDDRKKHRPECRKDR